MSTGLVDRDERTGAVENASYRWSYLVLSFGLLGIAAFRAFARGEATWDLLALVVLGGGVNAAYQGSHRILSQRWFLTAAVTFVLAALVAAGMILVRGHR